MKFFFLFLIALIPIKIQAISASSYIVMDANSKRVLEGSNIHSSKLIASTTKILTAIIALEKGNLDDIVTVSKEVLKSTGSNIYVEIGEEITLEDLIYGLLLRSGNDAAIEIANHLSGSMEEFAKLMNEYAKKIGMENTIFINSSGLEDNTGNGNKSTAYDMALLMSYAIKNDKFVEISGTKKKIVKTNYKTYEWYNKNKLLNSYKYTIAGKTGYTKKALRTLVTAAKKDDEELIVVTLNNPNDFSDHKELYEKNFKKYNNIKLIDKDNFYVEDNIFYDNLYINNDIKVLLTSEEEEKITINYEIKKLDTYKDGDAVGEVVVKLGEEVIARENIYAKKEEIKEKSFWQKLIDFLIFWK